MNEKEEWRARLGDVVPSQATQTDVEEHAVLEM